MHIIESGSDDLYYVPFLTLSGDSVLTLPPVLDGSFPIALPEPLPLGVDKNITTYTTAYVSDPDFMYTNIFLKL